MQGVAISFGKPWPPYSAGCCTPCQPPSPNCRNASLKPGVVVTSPSVQLLGLLVAFDIQRRQHFAAELRGFFEHGLGGVEIRVLEAGQRGDCSRQPVRSSRTACLSGARYSSLCLLIALAHAKKGAGLVGRRALMSPTPLNRLQFGAGTLSRSSVTSSGTTEQIADEAVVGDAEDRRFRVLVDRDDHLASPSCPPVLDRAGDADRDVQLRRDDLAGLADLIVVGHEARVHRRARCAQRRVQLSASGSSSLLVLAAPRPRPPETMIFAAVSSGRSDFVSFTADELRDARVGGCRLLYRRAAALRRQRHRSPSCAR